MLLLLILNFLVVCLSATFSFLIWRGLQKNVVNSAKVVVDLRNMADQLLNASSELKQTTNATVKKEETKTIFVNPYMKHKFK